MANWQLSDEYKATYPGIEKSILNKLVFSKHAIDGNNFTGTIDVSATGIVIKTIASLIDVTTIEVAGTITESNDTLNVILFTPKGEGAGITKKLAANLPLIETITKSAWLDLQTNVKSGEDQKPADTFDIHVDITLGSKALKITAQIPINGGLMIIQAQPVGFGIALSDLSVFLNSEKSSWEDQFPKPYESGGELELINISLTAHIGLDPRKITITSVTATIGIVGFPIINEKLYLNPLAVWVTITNPTNSPEVTYGLIGDLALVNYQTPGKYEDPDFKFDIAMELSNFSITGELENPENKPITTMLKDLFDANTDIGIPDTLTVNKFDFAASSNADTGKVTDYSFDVAMSGGFGIFGTKDIDIEEMSISFAHTG